MAELSSDLQASIDALGTQHTNLVQAVRDYTGGSVASATNDMLASVAEVTATIKGTERNLLGLVDRSNGEKLPSMLLDFASQTYFTGLRGLEEAVDPHKYLNVSRNTSKWVMGPQGKLVEVPPNTLAYEYDPVTGESKGVLIEEDRTNLLTYSHQFDNTAWSQRASISTTGKAAPDGTSTYYKAVPPSGDTYQTVNSAVSVDDGKNVTMSVFFSPAEWNSIRLGVRGKDGEYRTGSFNSSDGSSSLGGGSMEAQQIQDDVWRVSFSCTVGTGTEKASVYIYPINNGDRGTPGDGTSGIYIWGAQLEEGLTPSSYIPTTDTPVTRAADNVYRELESEYNPAEGTVIIECDVAHIRTTSDGFATAIASWGEPSRGNTFTLYTGGSGRTSLYFRIYGAAGIQTIELGYSVLSGVNSGRIKIAAAYNVTTGAVTVASMGQASTETWSFDGYTAEAPELLLAELGKKNEWSYSPPAFSCGDLSYVPRALSETELQELTANG